MSSIKMTIKFGFCDGFNGSAFKVGNSAAAVIGIQAQVVAMAVKLMKKFLFILFITRSSSPETVVNFYFYRIRRQ